MKIVTYASSVIWNENHPALKKYGDDCLVVRHGPAEELISRIGDDRDVLVLTDNDPSSFELYDVLADAFHSRRIHLFACLPFTYESGRRKREILAHLGNLEMARSLCLVKLDDFLAGSNTGETLGSLQLRIRNDMIVLLEQAAEALADQDEFVQYLYDPESGGYVPADLSAVAEELNAQLFGRKQPENIRTEEPEIPDTSELPAEPETEEQTHPEAETGEPEEPAADELGTAEKLAAETTAASGPELKTPGEPASETVSEPAKKTRRSLFSFFRRNKD